MSNETIHTDKIEIQIGNEVYFVEAMYQTEGIRLAAIMNRDMVIKPISSTVIYVRRDRK